MDFNPIITSTMVFIFLIGCNKSIASQELLSHQVLVSDVEVNIVVDNTSFKEICIFSRDTVSWQFYNHQNIAVEKSNIAIEDSFLIHTHISAQSQYTINLKHPLNRQENRSKISESKLRIPIYYCDEIEEYGLSIFEFESTGFSNAKSHNLLEVKLLNPIYNIDINLR